MVEVLGESCEQFGNEMGNIMMPLKDVRWGIVIGVGNTAQSVERKLTENEERNNKREQFPT